MRPFADYKMILCNMGALTYEGAFFASGKTRCVRERFSFLVPHYNLEIFIRSAKISLATA